MESCRKISEVDRLTSGDGRPRSSSRGDVLHTERVGLLHGKKTIEGQQERLEILRRHGVIFDPVRERTALGRSRVAIDDLFDAGGCFD
jgi:hypothetical protein